jgi:sec-independent protein translocase protein TatA
MLGIGPLELVLVAFILLMLFGARRLPEVGRSLGSGMREFKEGIVHPVDDIKEGFASSMAEQERPAERTPPALTRGIEAETGSAPKMRDAVSE